MVEGLTLMSRDTDGGQAQLLHSGPTVTASKGKVMVIRAIWDQSRRHTSSPNRMKFSCLHKHLPNMSETVYGQILLLAHSGH